MTWLLGKLIANPMTLLWLVLGALAFGAASGGSAAWYVQQLRVTSLEQDHTAYVQDQTRIMQEAKYDADRQRYESSQAFAAQRADLEKSIKDHAIYRRCVDAGKCGARVQSPAACTCLRLPSAIVPDGTGSDPISIIAGTAAEDPVVNDCAITTLMLNQLQADIEKQPGYAQ